MKIEAPLAAAFLLLVGCSSEDKPASPTTTTTAGSGGAGGAASTSSAASSTTGGGTAGSTGSGTGGSGTGGSGTGGSGGGSARPAEIPATDSSMDIAAFVQAGRYKMAPWISDVAAPRMGGAGTQHGNNIRVWLNPTVVTALKAGRNGQMSNPPPDQYSMAVKEMYDDAKTNVVGVAVSLRSGSTTGSDSWTYFCYAPDPFCLANRMGTMAAPIYGKGNMAPAQQCAICHGNTIYTTPP